MVNCTLYIFLVFHKLAVSWTLDFVSTETRSLVDFVVGVRTFEEEYLSIALESKDVGTETSARNQTVSVAHIEALPSAALKNGNSQMAIQRSSR